MANVAFLFTGVSNISGGGGAERFFADFFEEYQTSDPKHNLLFITDKTSLQSLNGIGKLGLAKNVLTYKIISNRFKNTLELLQLVKLIIFHKIKLIQIPLYNKHYYPIVKAIDGLPVFIRPKIVITITDSFIPHCYFDKEEKEYNFKNVYNDLFENVKIDSVISWYELFKEFSEKNNVIKSKPEIFCIHSRYSGKKFNTTTPKKNNIIFASRLTRAKKPLMFIEAIHLLKERLPEISNWKFFIYGQGHMEENIKAKIKEYNLSDNVILTHHHDLTSVFEESRCFVSTQDFENFPSLSMNEAMAAGNTIISRNVGQTGLFVKDNVNGLLLKEDNEKGLADALETYIKHPEWHEKMAMESIKLTKEVHTFANFKNQIESFWTKTLN